MIAGTKREMLVGKSSQGLAPHRATAGENMDDTAFSFPENVDDLMNIAKSLEVFKTGFIFVIKLIICS